MQGPAEPFNKYKMSFNLFNVLSATGSFLKTNDLFLYSSTFFLCFFIVFYIGISSSGSTGSLIITFKLFFSDFGKTWPEKET